jgi:hypothetical protein
VGEVCRWSFELKLCWTGKDDIQTICDYAKGICASKKSGHDSANRPCAVTHPVDLGPESFADTAADFRLDMSKIQRLRSTVQPTLFGKCLERTCDVLNRQLNCEGTTRIRPFPETAASAVRVVASDGK